MTIEVSLSTESIQRAIRELQTVQDNIEREMGEVIDTLTQEGADVARQAIGSMAAVDHVSIGNEGMIEVTGKGAVFQEFGAGQAVMPYLFENPEPVPVHEGSYSETEGSGEYASTGSWHFGGKYYTEIPARHGLLDAREWIRQRSTEIAQEMIQL